MSPTWTSSLSPCCHFDPCSVQEDARMNSLSGTTYSVSREQTDCSLVLVTNIFSFHLFSSVLWEARANILWKFRRKACDTVPSRARVGGGWLAVGGLRRCPSWPCPVSVSSIIVQSLSFPICMKEIGVVRPGDYSNLEFFYFRWIYPYMQHWLVSCTGQILRTQ